MQQTKQTKILLKVFLILKIWQSLDKNTGNFLSHTICFKSLYKIVKKWHDCSSHKINCIPSVSNHSLVPHLDNRTSEKGRHCHGLIEFSLMVIWVSILNIWIQVLSKIVLFYLKWLKSDRWCHDTFISLHILMQKFCCSSCKLIQCFQYPDKVT